MKVKKIPLRTCVGCGLIRPKRELVRMIVGEDGSLKIDPTGKAKGRGAYLCRISEEILGVQSGQIKSREDQTFTPNSECQQKATEKHALERALKKSK
ncbi:hypothetical protein A2X44_02645 [candidate division CPR3 bacterium GWF2_35_18]|uniref:YlxR domain-containing protein n=1 Tax=candidate division CPR3 bacterium GW2011_GWF2_35_18 TaxID=1618350 RepID=A0A0G0BIL0_UNCC3|nr:MAG: hypothetical protein UR67_C0008G0019 [candidate division CPR3 bacterium GW2011_GWF2_35_18]KKP87108.1 MAG: hypothetical protein UR87_C0004G0008 [candidate division CPR3 bacterium GW2011_GWE2_35_7]OGB62491.1 MAG: hypothetical protein A2X44_02645 [candidate division CPR3 bacterium GWF2_35_18]OGB65535.1 MAG: hypothetical protein A2250_04225 [candidate division CPR3 bacterium RIFOXYA2_FULL_35_13]OGB76078.1 MAG: hypothetical protein A2476_05505 [candidate division CPR3 bacterium RIFOXYC2_FULL